MANLLIDGFDYLSTNAQLEDAGWAVDTTVGTTTGRNSGIAMRCSGNGSSAQWGITGAPTSLYIGFAFRTTAADAIICRFREGTTTHVGIFWNSAGFIEVRRSTGTVLGTGTTALSLNTFYYIEFFSNVSNTVGAPVVKINGATETINYLAGTSTTQDTQNGATGIIDNVQFLSATGQIADLDDMYINDATGGVDDTFWGDIRVIAKTVDGAGNSAQFTPSAGSNYQNVDEMPPNGDTDYNESSTVNHIDSMTTTALGVTGTVKGVAVGLYARKTDAGVASLAPLWRISGTDYPGTGLALSTDYLYWVQRYRVSPATSSAWTTSEIDGAELGYKRTA